MNSSDRRESYIGASQSESRTAAIPEFNKKSESRRGIHPQKPGFGTPRVLPTMRRGALEIEAVAGFQDVVLLIVQPDLEFTAQNVEKLLPLMSVRFAAAPSRFDAEQVRLHRGVAPGQEFHADTRRSFEDFAVLG